MSELLTEREIIGLTKMSQSTVRRRVADGSFPAPVKIGPRCIRFKGEEVEAWLDSLPVRPGLLRKDDHN